MAFKKAKVVSALVAVGLVVTSAIVGIDRSEAFSASVYWTWSGPSGSTLKGYTYSSITPSESSTFFTAQSSWVNPYAYVQKVSGTSTVDKAKIVMMTSLSGIALSASVVGGWSLSGSPTTKTCTSPEYSSATGRSAVSFATGGTVCKVTSHVATWFGVVSVNGSLRVAGRDWVGVVLKVH